MQTDSCVKVLEIGKQKARGHVFYRLFDNVFEEF